jgi:hypothetical protein
MLLNVIQTVSQKDAALLSSQSYLTIQMDHS